MLPVLDLIISFVFNKLRLLSVLDLIISFVFNILRLLVGWRKMNDIPTIIQLISFSHNHHTTHSSHIIHTTKLPSHNVHKTSYAVNYTILTTGNQRIPFIICILYVLQSQIIPHNTKYSYHTIHTQHRAWSS